MALKSFKDLYSLDINKYVQKKPTFLRKDGKLVKTDKSKWLDYIEWSMVLFLLYDNGAEFVSYEFITNESEYPAFFNDGKNPFVRVRLKIDDIAYPDYFYPVIDGNKVDTNPNQMSIHRAQQRALVKCVAVNTGLGLKLWQKEEHQFDELGEVENKTKLPELTPDDAKWNEAIKALKNNYTIEKIEQKYYLTDENRTKLLNEVI